MINKNKDILNVLSDAISLTAGVGVLPAGTEGYSPIDVYGGVSETKIVASFNTFQLIINFLEE